MATLLNLTPAADMRRRSACDHAMKALSGRLISSVAAAGDDGHGGRLSCGGGVELVCSWIMIAAAIDVEVTFDKAAGTAAGFYFYE